MFCWGGLAMVLSVVAQESREVKRPPMRSSSPISPLEASSKASHKKGMYFKKKANLLMQFWSFFARLVWNQATVGKVGIVGAIGFLWRNVSFIGMGAFFLWFCSISIPLTRFCISWVNNFYCFWTSFENSFQTELYEIYDKNCRGQKTGHHFSMSTTFEVFQ